MRARWWYREEKEENINKTKLFVLKPPKCTQDVLKQNLCFQLILLRDLLSLSTRGFKVIL